MAKKISKEELLLEYIKEFQNVNGYPPTVREMCTAVNVSSTSTIAYYLSKLENNGQIKKNKNKNRALEIIGHNETKDVTFRNDIEPLYLGENANMTTIPMLGTITAGQPILAVENHEEYYMVSPSLFKGDGLFMLTVRGESMINAGIYDGDKVVLKQQSTANNGDIVAALIDGAATIKRFYKENGHYRLQPENDTMAPIIVDHVDILGKLVGLVRKF